MPGAKKPFLESKTFDVLATAPLIVWYGFAVAGIGIRSVRLISDLPSWPDWHVLIDLGSQLATALFLGLQVVLFLVRRLPLAKAPGIAPRIAGVVGANLALAFLALPRASLSPPIEALSTTIVLLATLASVVVAFRLGRAFSILPQARSFVASGPYRLIRHPLYLAEQIGTWGLMLQYVQPWAVLIALASLAAQFPRMHYEEQILHETFPEYAAYASRTKRLVPGVY
ncbi:MAG: methyltransferase family protein [Rhizomicrobium sp.]